MYEAYYLVVSPLWLSHGLDDTVTSTIGDRHMQGSKHYEGLAIDLRTWQPGTRRQLSMAYKEGLAKTLRSRLDDGFQVVVKPTHIHIEWDPR